MEKLIYVPQDSYVLYHPTQQEPVILHADGVSSGIALALTGADADGQPLAVMAHLTSPIRFRRFFHLVEQHFSGQAVLTACGASSVPTDNGTVSYDAMMNMSTLLEWASPLLDYPGKNLFPLAFSLSQADLQLGCQQEQLQLHIDCNAESMFLLHHDAGQLPISQRDPIFLLASLFGVKTMLPSLILHEATAPFTKSETDALVWEARREHWDTLYTLSDHALLEQFCSTSNAPSWYASLLRNSSQYVADYGEISADVGRRAIQF